MVRSEVVPVKMTPRQFTEFAVHLRGSPIDLAYRPWLHRIYDQPFLEYADGTMRRKMLLIFGRQCEKTCVETEPVLMASGEYVPIKDVQVGDSVATMAEDGAHMSSGPVVWKSRRYRKECVRVTTGLGHEVLLGVTHPLRLWGRWVPAGDLKPGDRVATVREMEESPGEPLNDDVVAFLGYMLGDGGVSKAISFTQAEGPALEDFRRIVEAMGWTYREYAQPGAKSLRFSQAEGGPRDVLERYGLYGCTSETKTIPDRLMRLPKHQVETLVKAMWACNGCVREVTGGAGYEIVYCSISKDLVDRLQALLWRLGVPTSRRVQQPGDYAEKGKKAYLLRVRTREGVERFLKLDVLGKSCAPRQRLGSNCTDTYPQECNELIRRIIESDTGRVRGDSLSSVGLRRTLKHPPTKQKLQKYVDFFSVRPSYDQELVQELQSHVDTDLFWDTVVSVEPIGEQWCYDLEVERTHNFLVRGLVTHNSTTIGNTLISTSNLIPYLRSLYVSASDVQMREFSDERLRAVINDSPKLLRLTRGRDGKAEVQNVQTKRWRNQSKIVLRSVYRSADRARGISADLLGCDEIQDIYTDVLPVIEETQFASDIEGGPIAIYAGTPKTFDNSLEIYWSRHSSQNEWLVRCRGCRHWNCIEIDNIGKNGLECTKCRKRLHPLEDGQWVRLGKHDAEWEGFRVPQPVVIHAFENNARVFERKWTDLLFKQRKYGRPQFQNEVMARSFDSGTKPVTFDEVRRCSLNEDKPIELANIDRRLKATHTWAGVDWGSGDESYTIISIWRYHSGGAFQCIFAKRYEGIEADPDFAIQDMIKIFRRFNVNRIGADWGFGFALNPKLLKAFGAAKVMLYMHAGKQKEKVKWDKLGMKFVTHRTRVLADVFALIKRGPRHGMRFFDWGNFETFANDILAVYQENSKRRGELIYDHPRGVPDDFLHTACYALLVSQFDHPRPDLHAPQPGQRDFRP